VLKITTENNHRYFSVKTNYLCSVVKKFIVAILAFLYLGVSSGIAMEIHYCMGEKAGVEFYGGDSKKCGKCGMTEKKNGCCNDEHKFYKLDDLHKKASLDVSFEIPVTILSNSFPVYYFLLESAQVQYSINNNSPPEYNKPSACVLNCVFRI